MELHQTKDMFKKIFQKLKNLYHLFEAILANIYYGFPSKKIKVIGVTGTDGKTTTTHLIAHILKESGFKVSFISTVYAEIAQKTYDLGFHVTTPSSFMIQKFLKMAVLKKQDFFVLETTSHALDQNRVWGVDYQIAVLTNVTHEHLDYHESYDNYLKTKLKLLKMARFKIINKDDQSCQKIKDLISGFETYSLNDVLNNKEKSEYLKKIFNDKKITDYNKENYLAAYSVVKKLGLSDKQFFSAVKTFRLPKGRLEIIYQNDFLVIIDFAHTPNAFLKLLKEVKKMLKKGGRLIHVFGAAGFRDKSKRPLMGKVSDSFACHIILTEEDYRGEKVEDICREIASGIKDKSKIEMIFNREKAIEKAVFLAKKNDIILLTGKSHEKSLARGNKEERWDEFEAVKKAIKNKKHLNVV